MCVFDAYNMHPLQFSLSILPCPFYSGNFSYFSCFTTLDQFSLIRCLDPFL